jgi:hypothetical protein
VKSGEEPPRSRRQPSTVGDDEVLRDSSGRVVDDTYVEGAVEDALSRSPTDDR